MISYIHAEKYNTHKTNLISAVGMWCHNIVCISALEVTTVYC